MELNQYQTPIEELVYKKMDPLTGEVSMIHFKDAPEEVQNEFNEAVATVPLIQWLISADRPKIGDLSGDENGRAIWRIEYPPIIENTDYFRPTALHFQKTGLLTDLRPNPNPNSEYAKWKDEEVRRIREGFLRESDGAYIPGYMYWYLNYCPIVLTLESEENEDVGDRIEEFPNVWEGLIWRFTGWQKARSLGKYFFEVSKRGSSKSYSIASGLSRGFVIGDRKPSPNHKAVTRGVVLADNKDFLIRDGTLNKFESMIDFQAENTQFPRKRLKNSLNDMSWTMGYIDLNTGTKKGTGNEVYGVAIKDDPGKVRGKRASLYALEEIGKFPNLAAVMKTAERSVKDGNVVFGLMIGVGTGGEEGNDFSGALDLIYHPTGSNILAFENVWDKSSQARGTSIFCFPAYVNRLGCYNKDGISDVTKALYQICWERYIAKYENPDPMQITRTKAEDPITLQDAIMRRDGTKFPVAQITERIQEIDLNPNFFDCVEVGRLVQESSGNVRFEPTGDKPIHKFPHKDNKIHGAVEIRVLPERNRDGKVFSGRYIAGCDPIDDDTSTTLSLVSIYVLDLWTDSLVCEWTGRLDDADSCYEICRLMCIFYNAKLNYENNKKGLYAYFKKMNCLYLLAETLEFLKDKEWVSGDLRGNKMYGVNANEHINGYARDRLKDWLLLPVKVVEKTPEGDKETTVPKVMTLWNRALLEECRQWNPDGNFDRVSAMGMLMLMREEKMIIAGGTITPDRGQSSKKDKGQDPFFERNYKPGKHHGIQ